MRKKHLIIAAHDGVFTYYTGVGTIVQNTIKTLNEMSFVDSLRISVAGIYIDKNSDVFNVSAYERVQSLVDKYNGSVISLSNDTNGLVENDTWKDPINWKIACNSLVSALNTVLNEDEDNFIMLHDTVFLYFEISQRQLRTELKKTIHSFYLPHSSGMCHYYTGESWNKIRLAYEKQCFSAIMSNPRSRLIATGHNFARHLMDNYDVSFDSRDFLTNGLLFENYHNTANRFCLYEDIKRFAPCLPQNSKIIFSWGRLSQAKGFYELLLAWEKIANKYPDHWLVLQAPTSCIEESDYFKQFSGKVNNVPRVIHIDNFSPDIWQTFLRYKNTDIVCLASTMDPNPHTPIEAKLFCKDMNYIIVASFKDGIKDSFFKGESVPIDDPCNIDDFADKLIQAIETNPNKRLEMSNSNCSSVGLFDYRRNVIDFLIKEGVL